MAEHSFKAQLTEILQEYSSAVTEGVNEKADYCADGLTKALRSDSPSRTHEYAKNWQNKVTSVAPGGAEEHTVFNKKHYRRTHLLEKGHKGPYGKGFVKAYPHIGPLAEQWQEKFVEEVEEVIKDSAK